MLAHPLQRGSGDAQSRHNLLVYSIPPCPQGTARKHKVDLSPGRPCHHVPQPWHSHCCWMGVSQLCVGLPCSQVLMEGQAGSVEVGRGEVSNSAVWVCWEWGKFGGRMGKVTRWAPSQHPAATDGLPAKTNTDTEASETWVRKGLEPSSSPTAKLVQ